MEPIGARDPRAGVGVVIRVAAAALARLALSPRVPVVATTARTRPFTTLRRVCDAGRMTPLALSCGVWWMVVTCVWGQPPELRARLGWRHASDVAWSPDSRTVAVATEMDLQLIDAKAGALAGYLSTQQAMATVAFSPQGETVVAGSTDGSLWIWRPASSAAAQTLIGHGEAITSVDFSRDGLVVASASVDGSVTPWEVNPWREILSLQAHDGGANSVAFGPEGTTLASGGDDRTVRLWDVATGRELAALTGHEAGVTSVAFRPGSPQVASGSADTTVKIWDIATGNR